MPYLFFLYHGGLCAILGELHGAVQLFGPGERVVFLPYSRETFESTQRWIHERDMFEEAPSCDYNAAVVN